MESKFGKIAERVQSNIVIKIKVFENYDQKLCDVDVSVDHGYLN